MSILAGVKSKARRAIHRIHGWPCQYTAPDGAVFPSTEQLSAGLTLTVRFGTKLRQFSPETDAVTIIEGVERVTFLQDQLDALAMSPQGAGRLSIPDLGFDLFLDQPMDPDGPLQTYWTVTRT